ncbi:hypothetical protein BC832DRAFT_378982 [Gaertneriomyces semiglobifer]|nr:hypothetical protein BC832DRAFT_378982 [Gaertneriomyces semiglobifer]
MTTAESDICAVWQAHRRTRGAPPKSVPSKFQPTCVISYVPTGQVYRGHREIEVLLGQMRETYFLVEDTKVLSTVYSENTVVEEAILTVRHERQMEYFLPGIKDTGRTLYIAMCTVSTFDDGKLASQRVYWDHASLLRQAGLLGQSVRGRTGGDVQIKIAGNDVAKVVSAAFENLPEKGSTVVPQQQHEEPMPQEVAHTPAIHQPVQAMEQPLPVQTNTTKTEATGTVTYAPDYVQTAANLAQPVTGSRQSVRLYAPPGGASHFSLGGGYEATPSTGNRNARSNEAEAALRQQDAANISARSAYAARNRGSFGFGNPDEKPVQATARTENAAFTSDRHDFAARNQSSFGFSGQEPTSGEAPLRTGAPPVTGKRISVKLHAPPGGNSQISFG